MKGVGVVLNGGQASRLSGRDKAALEIGAKSNLSRIVRALSSGADKTYVSVGADYPDDSYTGFEVIRDENLDAGGPARAVLSVLDFVHDRGIADFVLTCPSDTPFVPKDFGKSMTEAWRNSGGEPHPMVAKSANGPQWLHALWPVSIRWKLEQIIEKQGVNRMSDIHRLLESDFIAFSDRDGDAFLNINTPDELARARARAD